jgi:uncharacterized membrane protein YozB (DUF420 family)
MSRHEITREVRRETGSGTDLWRVIAGPSIWAVHFLICYVTAAVHCQKAGRDADLDSITGIVIVATLLALASIAGSAFGLLRTYARSLTEDDFDFEHDSREERHRFLSHVALMLSVLAAVGVIYVAIPVLYLGSCR